MVSEIEVCKNLVSFLVEEVFLIFYWGRKLKVSVELKNLWKEKCVF